MSADRFIPGPWEIGPRYGKVFTEVRSAGRAVAAVWTHELARDTDGAAIFVAREEGEATARMIASAPRVLAALERLLADMQAQENLTDAWQEADAAIAEAYGRPLFIREPA